MGEEAKDTVNSMTNLGDVNMKMGDYQAALDC